MDADFSHKPEYLPHLLSATANADLALGCRYMEGGEIEGWEAHRQFISRGGNLYARAILGMPFRDLTGGSASGARFSRASTSRRLQCGVRLQIELTWRAWQAGFLIEEVPIVFPDRVHGESKMSMRIMHEGMLGVLRMRFR